MGLFVKNKKFKFEINNKEIEFICNKELQNAANYFIQIITQEENSNVIIKPNNVIAIGFNIFKVEENKNIYKILTCDLANEPLKNMTEDLSLAIEIFSKQIKLVQDAKIEPLDTNLKNTLIISKTALKSTNKYMQRMKPTNERDSGWYIGALNDENSNNPNDFHCIYTYQLLNIEKKLLNLLQFPVGTLAIIKEGKIIDVVDSNNKKLL